MKLSHAFLVLITFSLFQANAQDANDPVRQKFDTEKDLLLVHYDCKTDVDDLHSVAAFTTLLANSAFADIHYHAVAGTYGIQEGPYVPPNPLFQLAFDDNWQDANANFADAVQGVTPIAVNTLHSGGDVWIAEAGQSDFSAALVRSIQTNYPGINTAKRVHIVQHSDWNEEVTSVDALNFVKQNADYIKIPDGNAEGNGTPGFRSPDYTEWSSSIKDSQLTAIWQLAINLGNQYNGKEGRYNNEAIAAGGLDFSDLSEVCWILGLGDIKDTSQFFELYGK